MATLIISDVHEKLDKLANALRGRIDRASRIVFLGDLFDSFKPFDPDRVRDVCRFINGNVDGMEWEGRVVPVTMLLGNHELHYFFNHHMHVCSGFKWQTKEIVQDQITPDTIRKFKIHTQVGPYLLSHAGFHPDTIQYINPPTQQDEAIELALQGKYPKIFGVGEARGGDMKTGGPMWLDWSREFEDIDWRPQIVGHTHGEDVRRIGSSFCLDTGLNHVGWIDEAGVFEWEAI
jgi:hypothetical protein